MATIFVVTDGDYSDYDIRAVFTDRALADAYTSRYGGSIEDWEADPRSQQLRDGFSYYPVYMDADGNTDITRGDQLQPQFVIGDGEQNAVRYFREVVNGDAYRGVDSAVGRVLMYTTVLARDKQHAVKIANEVRAQEVAAGRFPSATDNDEYARESVRLQNEYAARRRAASVG